MRFGEICAPEWGLWEGVGVRVAGGRGRQWAMGNGEWGMGNGEWGMGNKEEVGGKRKRRPPPSAARTPPPPPKSDRGRRDGTAAPKRRVGAPGPHPGPHPRGEGGRKDGIWEDGGLGMSEELVAD